MSTPEGADYRLSLFNRQGMYIDELDASFHCIWMAGDIGKADFTMSTSDEKCTKANLNFGNYVLFEHKRLGNWCGIICPHDPRRWSGQGQVTIQVISVEYQFNRRRASGAGAFSGSAGAIFTQMCNLANQKYDALIRFSDGSNIWGGGPDIPVTLNNQLMSDVMATVDKIQPVDWWFEPRVVNNVLTLAAHLQKQMGTSKGYALLEGTNIETPTGDFYSEEGDIINDDLALGSGVAQSDRPEGRAISQPSIDQYGLWEGVEGVTDADAGNTQGVADSKILNSSQPVSKIMLTAIESEESPDTFANIGTGDIVTANLYSVGFYSNSKGIFANVRILSREYSTDVNKVILVSQVL
jgi:hypothetical protein